MSESYDKPRSLRELVKRINESHHLYWWLQCTRPDEHKAKGEHSVHCRKHPVCTHCNEDWPCTTYAQANGGEPGSLARDAAA